MRARDLRVHIKEMGFENGVVFTLERMIEEHIQDRQRVSGVIKMIDQCINLVVNMTTVGDNMKTTIEAMRREHSDEGATPIDPNNR